MWWIKNSMNFRHNLRQHYDRALHECHWNSIREPVMTKRKHARFVRKSAAPPRIIDYIGRKSTNRHGMLQINKSEFHLFEPRDILKDIHRTLFCDLCPRSFFRKNFLFDHTKGVHLNLPTFDCKACSHRSFSEDDLKKHDKSHGPKT